MDWNDVRFFLALARSGSVRAAGTALSVSHSTVLRRIEAMEEQLAVRLFDRHRDGFQLTEAGRNMVPGAERIEREMSALERGLAGCDERLAGTVSVTCCDSFVSDILLEELAGFCTQHPEIELALAVDARPFDLAKREADIAIRALPKGTDPPDYLIGIKAAPITIANYVSSAHAHRMNPSQPEGRWLAFEERKISEVVIQGSSYPELPLWGAFGSVEAMVQAVRYGMGLGTLMTYAGDRAPALVRLPQADVRHMADLWVLSHPDLRDNARIRAVRREILHAFKRKASVFSGDRRSGHAPERCEITPATPPNQDVP